MARYYFDVTNGNGLERDSEGQELQSLDHVRHEAGRILSDIAKDEIPVSRNVSIKVAVRNSEGTKVHTGELSFPSD